MSDLVHNYYISHILYLVVFFAGCWFAGGGLLIWLYYYIYLINFATASDPLYPLVGKSLKRPSGRFKEQGNNITVVMCGC